MSEARFGAHLSHDYVGLRVKGLFTQQHVRLLTSQSSDDWQAAVAKYYRQRGKMLRSKCAGCIALKRGSTVKSDTCENQRPEKYVTLKWGELVRGTRWDARLALGSEVTMPRRNVARTAEGACPPAPLAQGHPLQGTRLSMCSG